MHNKKLIFLIIFLGIIFLKPINSLGQSDKIGDYKYSISTGINYGVFFLPWIYIDTTTIDCIYDKRIDSVKTIGNISFHIEGNFRLLKYKKFTLSTGLNVSDYYYTKRYYYDEHQKNLNQYIYKLTPYSKIHITALSIPISCNLKINKFVISAGSMFYVSWHYAGKTKESDWFTMFNPKTDGNYGFPVFFVSTSYYLYKINNSYLLPKIGIHYRSSSREKSIYINTAIQYNF